LYDREALTFVLLSFFIQRRTVDALTDFVSGAQVPYFDGEFHIVIISSPSKSGLFYAWIRDS
jgi:hypothetical protein